MSWRQATREELRRYYTEEFPEYIPQLPSFITASGPKQFALAFRDSHPVRKEGVPDKEFIRRDTRHTDALSEPVSDAFPSMEAVVEFIRHPARNDPLGRSPYGLVDPDLLDSSGPCPHAVYYALDHWDRPWVLLVDIDAKMIARRRATQGCFPTVKDPSTEKLLSNAGIIAAEPAGYPYSFEDIRRAIEYGFEVREIFESDFAADRTRVVYSGQGVHVYLLDTDLDHRYDAQSREVLNDLLTETYDIPIDPVVTADRRRVARLPYSLHAEVCRVVQPIESPDFDPREAVPTVIQA